MTSTTSKLTFEFIPQPALPCDDGTKKTCMMGVLRHNNQSYEIAALTMKVFPTDAENARQRKSFEVELNNFNALNKRFPSCKYFPELIHTHETTFYFRRCHGDLETLIINGAFPTTRRICTWDDRVKLAHSVLKCTSFLHKNGLIHLSMKADNILVTDDEQPKVKLCDLRTLASTDTFTDRHYMGSFCFASPECCLALANHTTAMAPMHSVFADEIWRVGIILHRLLEGKDPEWLEIGTALFERDDFMGTASLQQYSRICKWCKDITRLNFLGLTSFSPFDRPSLTNALQDFDVEVALMRMEG